MVLDTLLTEKTKQETEWMQEPMEKIEEVRQAAVYLRSIAAKMKGHRQPGGKRNTMKRMTWAEIQKTLKIYEDATFDLPKQVAQMTKEITKEINLDDRQRAAMMITSQQRKAILAPRG